jgi:hypothetical protein
MSNSEVEAIKKKNAFKTGPFMVAGVRFLMTFAWQINGMMYEIS